MGDASDRRDPAGDLARIAEEVAGCVRCPLAARRTRTVPGEGSPWTDVLLVGEGPGAREDATGRPFVGPAGELLNELLGMIGWQRSDVFIANVVKCRPPGNRDPEPDEIAACAPFLERQEATIEPSIVVTLGRHSLQRYLPGARIGQVHGRVQRSGSRWVFPMYHPAAALHQASLRDTLVRDIRGLPAALLAAREAIEMERASADSIDPGVAADPGDAPPTAERVEEADQLTLF
jgi:DNA polymerase